MGIQLSDYVLLFIIFLLIYYQMNFMLYGVLLKNSYCNAISDQYSQFYIENGIKSVFVGYVHDVSRPT